MYQGMGGMWLHFARNLMSYYEHDALVLRHSHPNSTIEVEQRFAYLGN